MSLHISWQDNHRIECHYKLKKFLEGGPNIWKRNLELSVHVNEDLQMPNNHSQPFPNGIEKVGQRIKVNVP